MFKLPALQYNSKDGYMYESGVINLDEGGTYTELLNWQDFSEAKVTCPATEEHYTNIKAGGGILSHEGVVWYVDKPVVDGNTMIVQCQDALEVFNQRVVRGTKNIYNTRRGFDDILVGTKDMPYCRLVWPDEPVLPSVEYQVTGNQVGDTYLELARRADVGFVPFAHSRERYQQAYFLQSKVRPGHDLTAAGRSAGFFSDALGNIDTDGTEIIDNIKNHKTYAVIAGEGEGAARVWTEVDIGSFDGQRRELFVDARDLQSSYIVVHADGSTTEHTYTKSEYIQVLKNRGLDKLKEHRRENSIAVPVKDSKDMKFGVHYHLGDLVLVYLSKFKLSLAGRCSSVLRVFDKGTWTVVPYITEFTVIGGD